MSRFERVVALAEDVFAWLAIAILLAATVSVCADVLMRYYFNRPFVWVTEVTEYGLVYMTFLGIAWAVPRKGHVIVDVFVSALPSRGRALCEVFNMSVCLVVALVLTIWGTTTTLDSFSRGLFRPTTLAIPTWIVLVVIPFGSALLSLRFLVELTKSIGWLVSGAGPEPDPAASAGLE